MALEKHSVNPSDPHLRDAITAVESLSGSNPFRAELLAILAEVEIPMELEARAVELVIADVKKSYEGLGTRNEASNLSWEDIEASLRSHPKGMAKLIEIKEAGKNIDLIQINLAHRLICFGDIKFRFENFPLLMSELDQVKMLALLKERFSKTDWKGKLSWEVVEATLLANPDALAQILEQERKGKIVRLMHILSKPYWTDTMLEFHHYDGSGNGVDDREKIRIKVAFPSPQEPLL